MYREQYGELAYWCFNTMLPFWIFSLSSSWLFILWTDVSLLLLGCFFFLVFLSRLSAFIWALSFTGTFATIIAKNRKSPEHVTNNITETVTRVSILRSYFYYLTFFTHSIFYIHFYDHYNICATVFSPCDVDVTKDTWEYLLYFGLQITYSTNKQTKNHNSLTPMISSPLKKYTRSTRTINS